MRLCSYLSNLSIYLITLLFGSKMAFKSYSDSSSQSGRSYEEEQKGLINQAIILFNFFLPQACSAQLNSQDPGIRSPNISPHLICRCRKYYPRNLALSLPSIPLTNWIGLGPKTPRQANPTSHPSYSHRPKHRTEAKITDKLIFEPLERYCTVRQESLISKVP